MNTIVSRFNLSTGKSVDVTYFVFDSFINCLDYGDGYNHEQKQKQIVFCSTTVIMSLVSNVKLIIWYSNKI